MQGQLPDFKPCHRLSAAKELLRRGFNHDTEDQSQDAYAATQPDPEPDPAEVEAQRRLAEDIEFSRHGPIYYASYPYPCVCEYRRHDCDGNLLNDHELEAAARIAPAKRFFIHDLATMEDFADRYVDYLNRHNADNPDNPIDFNLIQPNLMPKHLLPPVRAP